ncbi:hypothetical protein EDD16DRAFT_287392 [Pisolithus croceorrhizus]|nr:hypothetical protein EDD16DRAFT_287392 [Pisolithus croceorrhizus]KAI6166197.1 hypothetical protein EDD17DRAFT_1471044 [Pisolithus thermaeus]
MPPRTRSSSGTINFPTTPSKPRSSTGSSGLATPGSTPRRAPHCTKCGRPRAGHPRSGCPYAAQSNPTSPSEKSKPVSEAISPHAGDDIADDLSSLHIVNPADEAGSVVDRTGHLKRRLSVRFALVPAETLASLSSSSSELVERLLTPGMMGGTCNSDDYGALLKWKRTLTDGDPDSHEPAARVITTVDEEKPIQVIGRLLSREMPGTLFTPTASLASTEPLSDGNIGGSVNMNDTIFLLPDPDIKKPRPLQRTMSIEQRSLFLERLSHSSESAPATLVSISDNEVASVRRDAEKIGFIVRELSGGGQNGQKWIILGTDAHAVDLLEKRFGEENRKRTNAQRGGKLKAVAGGALLGAVATWTGLAFS